MLPKWINTKNVVCAIIFLLVILCIPKIINIFLLFYAAFVVTSSMEPFIEKLQKYTGRKPAAAIIVLAFFILSILMLIPIIIAGVHQIIAFIQTLPDTMNNTMQMLSAKTLWGHKLTDLIDLQDVINTMGGFTQNIVNKSIDFTVNIAQISVFLVVFTMIVFYFAMDKEYIDEKFSQFFPPEVKENAKNILNNISGRVGAYVRTQAIAMVAVGFMVMIGLMILGIKYAFLLGLISGILDIIPIIGPAIALIAIVLVAYSAGWIKVLLAIAIFLICQQLSNYVVRPFLFGKFMSLHPLTLLLALFIAQKYLGIIGIILSPAIASTICVLVDELYIKKINTEGTQFIEEKPSDGN